MGQIFVAFSEYPNFKYDTYCVKKIVLAFEKNILRLVEQFIRTVLKQNTFVACCWSFFLDLIHWNNLNKY